MDLVQMGKLLDNRREGHCLPGGLYNDPAVFDFDLKVMFGTSWLIAGFTCELPKPGSYVAQMIGSWPIIIIRDRNDVIRAFHNSCRHRGSILCQPGSGSAPKLVCPYHRWTYDLDGSLFAANRMADDFDKSMHGLKPIALEIVAGAMFICLADEPPPFDEFRNKLAIYAAPHKWAEGKLAYQSVLVENANWKLVMENARECYHCATGHPELARTFPVSMSKHFDCDGDAAAQRFLDEMAAVGLVTDAVEGDWWQLARFALSEGSVSITMDGKHAVKQLMCDLNGGAIGSMRMAIDPHCFVHATADHTFMFSAMPISPTETHVVSKWIVHKDAVAGVDYDVDNLAELWSRTNLQDKELAENNQRGVNSPGFTPGPYSPEAEMLALRFTDWYCNTGKAYLAAHGD
jgi:glycine betaine catabolism A